MTKYVKALLDRGKPADELKAMAVLGKAYKESGQFRFRKMSGEIQVKRAVKNLEAEGFRFHRMVDIFDAGPVLSCPRDEIRTVSQSRRATVARSAATWRPRADRWSSRSSRTC